MWAPHNSSSGIKPSDKHDPNVCESDKPTTTLIIFMGGTSVAAGRRVTRFLASHHRDVTCVVADVEFDFLDDIGETLLAQSASSDEMDRFDEDEDHRDTVEENRTFWDNQHQLLQVTIHPILITYLPRLN